MTAVSAAPVSLGCRGFHRWLPDGGGVIFCILWFIQKPTREEYNYYLYSLILRRYQGGRPIPPAKPFNLLENLCLKNCANLDPFALFHRGGWPVGKSPLIVEIPTNTALPAASMHRGFVHPSPKEIGKFTLPWVNLAKQILGHGMPSCHKRWAAENTLGRNSGAPPP